MGWLNHTPFVPQACARARTRRQKWRGVQHTHLVSAAPPFPSMGFFSVFGLKFGRSSEAFLSSIFMFIFNYYKGFVVHSADFLSHVNHNCRRFPFTAQPFPPKSTPVRTAMPGLPGYCCMAIRSMQRPPPRTRACMHRVYSLSSPPSPGLFFVRHI